MAGLKKKAVGRRQFEAAHLTLGCPIYACDFGPQDATKLVVGGGGGVRAGDVPNKMYVLDTASRDLRVVGEANLSRDEDYVTTLAVGRHKGKGTQVYAGINSGPADIAKQKNEHLRLFNIEASRSRAAGANTVGARITEASRYELFQAKDANAYQRVLRVSPPYEATAQLGAVATGMARASEIAVFDVPPTSGSPRPRGRIELAREADDLDILQTGDEDFLLAYCAEDELHLAKIVGKTGAVEPQLVYTQQHDAATGASSPRFRAIRFLTPTFILAIANLRKENRAILQAIRLPSPKNPARLAATAPLPSGMKKATVLAVRNLSPPARPADRVGDAQFVIAVTGSDHSIAVYALDHAAGPVDVLGPIRHIKTIADAHGAIITSLALSPFAPPPARSLAAQRSQFLRLASASVANTVDVEFIPLRRRIDRRAPQRKGGPPRPARYVVGVGTGAPGRTIVLALVALVVVLLAVAGQAYLEMTGVSRPILHAPKFLPSWYGSLRTPDYVPEGFLSGVLGDAAAAAREQGRPVVLTENAAAGAGVSADAHDEAVHGPARAWEQLPGTQKKAWKERLKHGGHYAEGMGEGVFKGILFGELAGAVGRAAA